MSIAIYAALLMALPAFREQVSYHFETSPDKSIGNVVLLTPGGDVREPWNMREIDRVPTVHRVRWIDPRGDGRKLLLVAPLVGNHSDHAPIYFYRPGEWKRETLSNELTGTLHSIVPVKWKRPRGESILTASFDGLRLFHYKGGGRWQSTEIAKGDPRPCPQCGRATYGLRISASGWYGPPSNRGTATRWRSTSRAGGDGNAS